jgi:hypothetical protein
MDDSVAAGGTAKNLPVDRLTGRPRTLKARYTSCQNVGIQNAGQASFASLEIFRFSQGT